MSLGVAPDEARRAVRRLFEAGVPVALGADDPLLFGPRLVKQYEIARDVHGFSPAELAELARMSVRGSAAPPETRTRLLSGHRRLAGRVSACFSPDSGRKAPPG